METAKPQIIPKDGPAARTLKAFPQLADISESGGLLGGLLAEHRMLRESPPNSGVVFSVFSSGKPYDCIGPASLTLRPGYRDGELQFSVGLGADEVTECSETGFLWVFNDRQPSAGVQVDAGGALFSVRADGTVSWRDYRPDATGKPMLAEIEAAAGDPEFLRFLEESADGLDSRVAAVNINRIVATIHVLRDSTPGQPEEYSIPISLDCPVI
jgi:hypothetical protein